MSFAPPGSPISWRYPGFTSRCSPGWPRPPSAGCGAAATADAPVAGAGGRALGRLLLAALAYALLAGWGVPAQRTVGMLALVALLRSLGLRWPLPAVLLAVAVGVTGRPLGAVAAGLLAVLRRGGLLVASEPVHHVERAASRGWLAPAAASAAWGCAHTGVATVGSGPLSWCSFQQVSVVGLLANLVAIPLVTLLITPLALLGVLLPPLWGGGSRAWCRFAVGIGLSAWPWAVWHGGGGAALGRGRGLLGGAAGRAAPALASALAGAAALVLPCWRRPCRARRHGAFEVVAADIGQGTAVLVRTARHLLVYDAGPVLFAPNPMPACACCCRCCAPAVSGRWTC
jgi:competence protein ComEC